MIMYANKMKSTLVKEVAVMHAVIGISTFSGLVDREKKIHIQFGPRMIAVDYFWSQKS